MFLSVFIFNAPFPNESASKACFPISHSDCRSYRWPSVLFENVYSLCLDGIIALVCGPAKIKLQSRSLSRVSGARDCQRACIGPSRAYPTLKLACVFGHKCLVNSGTLHFVTHCTQNGVLLVECTGEGRIDWLNVLRHSSKLTSKPRCYGLQSTRNVSPRYRSIHTLV